MACDERCEMSCVWWERGAGLEGRMTEAAGSERETWKKKLLTSSGTRSDIPSGISSGLVPGASSDIVTGVLLGIASHIFPGVVSGKPSGVGVLLGISSDILSGG